MDLLNQQLAARLRQQHVDVQIQDPDTVLLRNVPADKRVFNKPATNLLLARPQEGMPFLVCVDEDLEYAGGDRLLARAFATAPLKQGWRVLDLGHEGRRDPHQALQFALAALGFDLGGAQAASGNGPAAEGGMLGRFGTDLTRKVLNPEVEPTVGRKETVERVTASICGWQARLALIEGKPGTGKTNLLHAVARKLVGHRPGSHVITVNLGVLLAGALCEPERENAVSALLRETATDSRRLILAMEHLEMAFLRTPGGALLIEQALDDGLRLLGTALPRAVPEATAGLLSRRLDVVRLHELDPADTLEVLGNVTERIARHHGVRIDPSILSLAVERAASIAGCFPSKAITLLDSAAARAALLGAAEVELLHIFLAGADLPAIDVKV